MMRSLWTGASGMIAQQTNVDTIANNLANINTTGYKSESVEFKSLLYQTVQKNSYDSDGKKKPVGVQVGLGVRNSAITSNFEQGNFNETGNQWDFALDGKGFFAVQLEDGSIAYTRSGSFAVTVGVNGSTLCDASGHPVLDTNGSPIVFDPSLQTGMITVDVDGTFYYPDDTGVGQPMGMQMGFTQFNNPAGLNKIGDSLFQVSEASGEPRAEANDNALKKTGVRQKYIESSNVSAVDAMVDLIVAQRAYEMNSKVITASDTMMQQANNLRG